MYARSDRRDRTSPRHRRTTLRRAVLTPGDVERLRSLEEINRQLGAHLGEDLITLRTES